MITNMEKLLHEYEELCAFYKSELERIPPLPIHYKYKNNRYKPYISEQRNGKQKQTALGKKNDPDHALENQLCYRRGLITAIKILNNNINCLKASLASGYIDFNYTEVDKRMPRSFTEKGWTFTKHMANTSLGTSIGQLSSTKKYDPHYALSWLANCAYPEYKKAVLANDWDKLIYDSGLGFNTRSKSEVLIASCVSQCKLYQKYENPIGLIVHKETKLAFPEFCQKTEIGDKKILLPDFTILLPDGREVIWEHEGMMDIEEYRKKHLFRQDLYARNGYFVGQNLFFTYETKEHPLDIRQINKVLRFILE